MANRASKIVVGGQIITVHMSRRLLVLIQLHSMLLYHVTGGLVSTWVGACYVMLCVVDLTLCVVINTVWPNIRGSDFLGFEMLQKATR
jgi:hypothetical protein